MPLKLSPKLRPNGWDALVVLLVAVLAAGSALAVRGGETEGAPGTVVVSIDGEEADRFPLEDLLESPRTYTNNGYTLEVVYGLRGVEAPGHVPPAGESGVRVIRSDCPTQDCVHTGLITRGGQSVICLPARIIIRLEGGAADPNAVDAVVG